MHNFGEFFGRPSAWELERDWLMTIMLILLIRTQKSIPIDTGILIPTRIITITLIPIIMAILI